MIIRPVINHGHRRTAEADVYRPLVLQRGADSRLCLHVVSRAHDHHAGDGAHQGNVLIALMGSAVLAYRDARMGSPDLHVQMRVSDGIAHLLKGPACSEHGKGADKGNLSHQRKPCRHAHHVGLRDTAVNMSVRICFLENACLGSRRQVRVQHHQVWKFLPQLL